jgi:peptidoglycan/xylan/chitin deacetylase (PgdA/CDA1 family)
VVVTFDDGTADFVDQAVPVLAAYGVPATVYVATQLVESGGTFPGGAPMVSWDALRDAASTGLVTVGSHTHTHRLLDRASVPDAIDELDRSRALIEERLGTPARHFAYPKAQLASPEVETEVRRRFASAAVAGTRPNPFGATDVFRLARSPIQRSDAMRWFHRKARGGMATEDHLRRLLDRRRLADAVT